MNTFFDSYSSVWIFTAFVFAILMGLRFWYLESKKANSHSELTTKLERYSLYRNGNLDFLKDSQATFDLLAKKFGNPVNMLTDEQKDRIMKRFATSDCKYLPGLLCLRGDGTITYDPKSAGADPVNSIMLALGLEQVEFETLLKELIFAGIEIRGPRVPENLSPIEHFQMIEYSNYCQSIGHKVANVVLADH